MLLWLLLIELPSMHTFVLSLPLPFSASIVATTFIDIVQKLHGNLRISVSDRDPIIMGNFLTELFSCLGT